MNGTTALEMAIHRRIREAARNLLAHDRKPQGQMTNNEYVVAILKGSAMILAWGLFLVLLMKYLDIKLEGPYAALKFLGFLTIFWLPASYFTKSARREMKRRKDAKQFH